MEPLAWYRIAIPIVLTVILMIVCRVRRDVRFRAMLMGVGMLASFGMTMDQVSVRLCPEYFTVLHAPIPNLTDPTLLGLAWGYLGSWWGGAVMGYVMGIVASVGSRRAPLPLRALVRPMVIVVVMTAIGTLITGIAVARHTEMLDVTFADWLDRAVPRERQRQAFIVANYHFAAYASAIVASVIMSVRIGITRGNQRNQAVD
jgi:hypothetical protein